MTDKAWIPPEEPDPHEILHSAVRDTREGLYPKALAKFLWFHKNALTIQPSLSGVRRSFALSYWLDLAAVYPPAQDAFVRTRDETELAFRKELGNFDLFSDLAAMNQRLGDHLRTADLFAYAAETDSVFAHRLYHVAERHLIAVGRFYACGPFLEYQTRIKNAAECYRMSTQFEESRASDRFQAPKVARKLFIEEIATVVGLLAINNRPDEARTAYDAALLVLDDNEFRLTLDAAMTGHLPEVT